MGHSDGMREGGHQIGPPSCEDMVKTASFLSFSFLTFLFIHVLLHFPMFLVGTDYRANSRSHLVSCLS